MKTEVLIQCRTSSSRLPGKALLPVAGFPSVILCARRAANSGRKVTVVTSTASSDETLCRILEAENVNFFRGNLDNVLARFANALRDADDDTPVVRLSADNLFVDGALIDELVKAFQKQRTGYLSLHPPALTGTPYGLSAEVFFAGELKAAVESDSLNAYDQEHVTPWIIRKHGRNFYQPNDLREGQGHLRCTMDTWSDYQKLLDVFGRVTDPINVGWQELCDHLQVIGPAQGVPQNFSPLKGTISELSFGAAQLGMSYGIANTDGQPSMETTEDLVHSAIAYGVTHFDCAAAYGEAEARLGATITRDFHSQVETVTKLSPLLQLAEDARDQDIESHVEASIYRSCQKLNTPVLPYLLLHRWQHRTSHQGRVWKALKRLQKEGVIRHLGASVQNPDEALQAIADREIRFIQLPLNLLDQRVQQSGFPQMAIAREDVIIQARSVLLQGLLVSPKEVWPVFPEVDIDGIIDQLSRFVIDFDRENIADLCVAYVRSQNWVDCLVMGMEKMSHLHQNVALFQRPPFTANQVAAIEAAFSGIPDVLLNPAAWPERGDNSP